MQRTSIAFSLLTALAPLALTPALADGDCRFSAPREATLDAAGASLLVLSAEAGSLRIEGKEGLSQVLVRGTACASSEGDLDEITLETGRDGDRLRVEAKTPNGDDGWGWNRYARLDLAVEVPTDLALEVSDGSGSIEVERTDSIVIRDGSGSIEIREVTGSVQIVDGSGEIEIRGVRGDVTLTDGSGEIDVRDVEGRVVVEEDGSGSILIADVRGDVVIDEDGSGGIEIERVGGGVRIRSDGSGGIRVVDVTGGFTVEDDGSGGISFDRVGGAVRIP